MLNETKKILTKLPRLFIGFFIIATGVVLMLRADLGMNPWGTLHDGITMKVAITFGQASQLTGISIILLGLLIKVYPGVATILNMYFIGYFVDLINSSSLIPTFNTIPLQLLQLIVGLLLFSYGLYLYLSCGIGAGPRDGLMVGLIKITGLSATYIKPAMEITVILIGFLMGGKVGIGTAIVALAGGYIVDKIFNFHKFNPKKQKQLNLFDHFNAIKQNS